VNYEEAFETAIRLSNDSAALEAFLATLPDWRDQLSRDLRLAQAVGRELRQLTPGASATLRRQRELLEVVAWHAEQPSPSWLARLHVLLLRPRVVASAALTSAVAVLAILTGLPAFSGGGGAITAEAVVIEGSVAEIGEGAVTINTADSAELVKLSSDTVLTDGFGNTVQAAALSTGQTVVLKGSRSDDGVVANQVELKDRLFGTVAAMSGDSIRLRTAQAEHTIAVTPGTEIEGPLRIGSYVEVKVLRVSDGSLRALEIAAEDSDDSGGSGSGSVDAPTAPVGSPAPANTPAAGSPGDDGGDDDEDSAEPEQHEDDDSHDGEHDEEEHQEDEHDDEHESDD
jgi:hypothetical protein